MKEMQALFVEQPHFTILATKIAGSLQAGWRWGADLNIGSSSLEARCFLLAENYKVLLQSGKC